MLRSTGKMRPCVSSPALAVGKVGQEQYELGEGSWGGILGGLLDRITLPSILTCHENDYVLQFSQREKMAGKCPLRRSLTLKERP